MRVARFAGNGVVEIQDAPLPRVAEGEVLLKVAYNGLCGSERNAWQRGFPSVVGHETSGTIVDSNGTDVSVGTRCVTYLPVFCGECKFCQAGMTNCCVNRSAMVGWSPPWNGGYGEYMRVPAKCVLPIDDRVGLDEAVLLLDTIGTAWHAVRQARPAEAERALVIGCGPLGLGVVAGLKAFGVPEVFACDLSPSRLAAAEELGGRPVSPADVPTLKGLQIAIEVVGTQPTIMQAIRAIEPMGRVVVLGEPHQPWAFEPTAEVVLRDFSFIRSWYFPLTEFAENQQMLLDRKMDLKSLISHVFPLESLGEAFELFWSGKTRKVLSQA